MLLPTKRGTHATYRGVTSYPPLEMMNMKNEGTRIDSQSMRMCSSKKQGGSWMNPLRFTESTGLNNLGISPPLQNSKLQMTVLLIMKDCDRQYSCNIFYFGFYQNYGLYQCYLTSNIVGFYLFQLLMLLTLNLSNF